MSTRATLRPALGLTLLISAVSISIWGCQSGSGPASASSSTSGEKSTPENFSGPPKTSNSSSTNAGDVAEPLTAADMATLRDKSKSPKEADPQLKGTYKAVLDETAIPANVRSRPDFPKLLEQAKANAPTMTFYENASVQSSTSNGPASGYLTKWKGHPVAVLFLSKPAKDGTKVLTLPLRVFDNGADFTIDIPGISRPLYKKVDKTTNP